jgi:hypothetical protein
MICPECAKETEGRPEDQGFGRGEFWGCSYNDVRMAMVCEYCDAELEDLSYAEWKFERECAEADFRYDERRERDL